MIAHCSSRSFPRAEYIRVNQTHTGHISQGERQAKNREVGGQLKLGARVLDLNTVFCFVFSP